MNTPQPNTTRNEFYNRDYSYTETWRENGLIDIDVTVKWLCNGHPRRIEVHNVIPEVSKYIDKELYLGKQFYIQSYRGLPGLHDLYVTYIMDLRQLAEHWKATSESGVAYPENYMIQYHRLNHFINGLEEAMNVVYVATDLIRRK